MGAWGDYDNENDNAHDFFYDIYDLIKDINVTEIKKITNKLYEFYKSTESTESTAQNRVGGLLILLSRIVDLENRGASSFDEHNFMSRIDGIHGINDKVQGLVQNTNLYDEAMLTYKIKNPELINKDLLRMILVDIETLSNDKKDIESYFDKESRIKAIKDEKNFFTTMLNSTNQTGGFYHKYMKYKKRYLNIKNNSNYIKK